MKPDTTASIPGSDVERMGDEVVEIALLLPSRRLEGLVDLARRSRMTVGQVIRRLIDRAVADGGLANEPRRPRPESAALPLRPDLHAL